MARIVNVKVVRDFAVELSFADGKVRQVDLEPRMRGPVFEAILKDPAKFREVSVDAEIGTIVWPNGADLCPDVLYFDGDPPWASPSV
ncbi:MAG: hypothetical protein A2289_12945 [Deltaproteobacteria bacterium RIFOXYA12_FULL_58_15]|nr:MAG: hypothetical protein A2289_12945 [Deltaproteobacteria bacterium RIFOXYA12_FULL_58_15]